MGTGQALHFSEQETQVFGVNALLAFGDVALRRFGLDQRCLRQGLVDQGLPVGRQGLQVDYATALGDDALTRIASLCMALGTDGLRGELTLMRAARALAALQGDAAVADAHIRQVARPALRHRLRRDPLDDTDASVRVDRVLAEVFGA